MDSTLFVPIAEIMKATDLTEIQIRKDIRAEILPGLIRGRNTIVRRSEWNAYLANEWQPRKPARGFIHRLSA